MKVTTSASTSSANKEQDAETTVSEHTHAMHAAKFCMFDCDHRHLFQSEYKRSNRTKGLKILRCFPHCCPNHIERSYCGSSLSVLVRPTASFDGKPSDVFVFARFETSVDASVGLGDTLSYDQVVASAQTEENPDGQWIPGIKERPSAHSLALKSANEGSLEHALFFQLNGKVYSRWYYDWESGANKAQRLMKHVLKAYVFQLIENDGNRQLKVVCIAKSPEFTVISYRRAPNEGGPVAKADVFGTPVTQSPKEDDQTMLTPSSNDASDHLKKRKRPSTDQTPRLSDGDVTKILQDQILWEHVHRDAVMISKNLALVYLFLQWTPLKFYASFVDELVHLMHSKVLEPLSIRRIEKHNCFSRILLEHTNSFASHKRRQTSTIPAPLESLLRVVAQAALCFFSDDTRQWLRGFFRQYSYSVIDKPAVRDAFLTFLTALEARLNRQVFALTSYQTLSNFAEEIVAAVYSYEAYHPKRPLVRRTLGSHGFIGWQPFVAQMRDMYIMMAPCTRTIKPRSENAWSGAWCLDMEASKWSSSTSHDPVLSLWTMCELMQLLARVDVELDVPQRRLKVRSLGGLAPPQEGMVMILDGKERVLRTYADGLSASIDLGSRGDYVASLHMDHHGGLVVVADWYQWAFGNPDESRSYHVHLQLECLVTAYQTVQLLADGLVKATMEPSTVMAEEKKYLRETKIRSKMQAFAPTTVLQRNPHQDKPPSSPWSEVGRFQLAYQQHR